MDDDLLQPEGGDGEACGGHAGPSKDIAARLEALRRENAVGPSTSAGGSQPSSRSAGPSGRLCSYIHNTMFIKHLLISDATFERIHEVQCRCSIACKSGETMVPAVLANPRGVM